MARMFDTEFDYRDETYTATVVISGSEDDRYIEVQVPEALKEIVPEKKIIVEHYKPSTKPEDVLSEEPELVESIMAAVDKHEQAEPPRGSLWS